MFDELVRHGTVGAVGASNFTAEQLAEALELSALEGLTRYEWVQNAFSLLEQGDAETVFPLCHEHGLGYTPFSPLAGGWLTGKYRRGEPPPPGSRMTVRPEGSEGYWADATFDALEELEREAAERGVSMAGLAVAWLLRYPEITAVVVGPNTSINSPRSARRSGFTSTSANGRRSRDCSGERARPLGRRRPRAPRHGVVRRGDGGRPRRPGARRAVHAAPLGVPSADRPADGPDAGPPRRRHAGLLPQGDRGRAGQRRARPRPAPGGGAAPRRRDGGAPGDPQRVRDHRDPHGGRLGGRHEAPRAAGRPPGGDPRVGCPGRVARAGDAGRASRPRAEGLEPHAGACRGARARVPRKRVRDGRGGPRRRRHRVHLHRFPRAHRASRLAGAGNARQRRGVVRTVLPGARRRPRRVRIPLRRPAGVDPQRVRRLSPRGRGEGHRAGPHPRRARGAPRRRPPGASQPTTR